MQRCKNKCYKNGKKISCKNYDKIINKKEKDYNQFKIITNKPNKEKCYINKKRVSCKNKIFKDWKLQTIKYY